MYSLHSLALLGSICLLHLVALSYGQTPDGEGENRPTRKRPYLRKIIIVVGVAIGFAALFWAIHKCYKTLRARSQKRRRLIERKELDANLEDLEKQEMNSNMSGQGEGQELDSADSAKGKYMTLNNASPEEEPLMTPERAPQYLSETDSKTKESGESSMLLLSDVPLDGLDPSGDQKLNLTEQGVGENGIEPSAPPKPERETQAK